MPTRTARSARSALSSIALTGRRSGSARHLVLQAVDQLGSEPRSELVDDTG
jgi:hypothetical protein